MTVFFSIFAKKIGTGFETKKTVFRKNDNSDQKYEICGLIH